jgi:hypothetical protein
VLDRNSSLLLFFYSSLVLSFSPSTYFFYSLLLFFAFTILLFCSCYILWFYAFSLILFSDSYLHSFLSFSLTQMYYLHKVTHQLPRRNPFLTSKPRLQEKVDQTKNAIVDVVAIRREERDNKKRFRQQHDLC